MKMQIVGARPVEEIINSYLTVNDIMTHPVVTAYESTSISKVADLMNKHGVDAIIIINKGREPVGIITAGDIVRRLMTKRVPFLFSKAKHAMSKPVEITKKHVRLEDAAKHMVAKKIKKLCVTDDKNKVIGVITTADITKNAGYLIDVLKEMVQTGFVGEPFREGY